MVRRPVSISAGRLQVGRGCSDSGAVAKWLRQWIANPPPWVQLPPAPLVFASRSGCRTPVRVVPAIGKLHEEVGIYDPVADSAGRPGPVRRRDGCRDAA